MRPLNVGKSRIDILVTELWRMKEQLSSFLCTQISYVSFFFLLGTFSPEARIKLCVFSVLLKVLFNKKALLSHTFWNIDILVTLCDGTNINYWEICPERIN